MVDGRDVEITRHFSEVLDEIGQEKVRSGRGGEQVDLVAVSKTFSAEFIRPVLQAGHRLFGENRVQEASDKWPILQEEFADVELHLIGPLQTNKTAAAVSLFDCIETLDRPKLARSIAAELKKQGKEIELFIQVNTGKETQKSGIASEELPEFLEYCQKELKLPINGLMCIPPVNENSQKHFALLADLAAGSNLSKLSMGMSSDFPAAIKCGATHVRVGTAIFGHR